MSEGEVTIDIKGDESDLDKSLKRSKRSVVDFGKVAVKAFAAVAAAMAVGKVAGYTAQLSGLYAEQEQAETRMASVLEATGHAAGFSASEMKKMASDMQNLTTIGDEVVLNAQSVIATFKNIKGDQFKDTLMIAADMAEVLGTDLTGASMQVAKALNNPTKGMAALADAGVSFTDQQKEMIISLQDSGDMIGAQQVILDELAGEFGGAASDAAGTFSGKLEQMQNTVGDLGEQLFEVMIPAIEALFPIMEGAIQFAQNWLTYLLQNKETISLVATSVVSFGQVVVEWVGEKAVEAVTVFQFAWQSMGDAAGLAANLFALGVVATFNDLIYMITTEIPGYLSWFADNWMGIFQTIGNFTGTIFSNIWKNITEFWAGLQSLFSGEGFEFEWTGLTEGFESAIKELPNIAKRELTPLEKDLADKVGEYATNIAGRATKLPEKLAENKKTWEDMFKVPEGAENMFDQAGFVGPKKPTGTGGTGEGKKSRVPGRGPAAERGGFASSLEGLESLNKRISLAAASTPELKAQNQTNDHLTELKNLNKTTADKQVEGVKVAKVAITEQEKQTKLLSEMLGVVKAGGGLE